MHMEASLRFSMPGSMRIQTSPMQVEIQKGGLRLHIFLGVSGDFGSFWKFPSGNENDDEQKLLVLVLV